MPLAVVDPFKVASGVGMAEPLLIFVIDTSGSMCVSEEVATATGKAYVSRLDAIKAAVDSYLERLAAEHPGHKAGLVLFDDAVWVVGDGTKPTEKFVGDLLFDYDMLVDLGKKHEGAITTNVSASIASIRERMSAVSAVGQTALGPALLTALGMSSNRPGSQLIICTDGLSTVGVGALTSDSSDLEKTYVNKGGKTTRAWVGFLLSFACLHTYDAPPHGGVDASYVQISKRNRFDRRSWVIGRLLNLKGTPTASSSGRRSRCVKEQG